MMTALKIMGLICAFSVMVCFIVVAVRVVMSAIDEFWS